MINPLDKPNTPFQVELLNPTPSSRRYKDAPRYWVRFEVSKETHDAFMTAGESHLRLVGYLSVLPDTDEQQPESLKDAAAKTKTQRSKDSKGPHSHLWNYLFKNYFHHAPGVRDLVNATLEHDQNDCNTEHVRLAMRKIFKTDSLTFIGPDGVREMFKSFEAQKMIDQAVNNVGGKVNV